MAVQSDQLHGVMSLHAASAAEFAISASRRSAGSMLKKGETIYPNGKR